VNYTKKLGDAENCDSGEGSKFKAGGDHSNYEEGRFEISSHEGDRREYGSYNVWLVYVTRFAAWTGVNFQLY
jgi:hypothetical protein